MMFPPGIISLDLIERFAEKLRETQVPPRADVPYDGLFLVSGVPFTAELDRGTIPCFECSEVLVQGHPSEIADHVRSAHEISVYEYAVKHAGRSPECHLPEWRSAPRAAT